MNNLAKKLLESSEAEAQYHEQLDSSQNFYKQQAGAGLKLPSRFTEERIGNKVKIPDTETGNSIDVALCNYRGALQALGAFCR